MKPYLTLAIALTVGAAPVVPAMAQSARAEAPAAIPAEEMDRIWSALSLSEALNIMQIEGRDMSEDIAADYLPAVPGQGWRSAISRIYDGETMAQMMRDGFAEDLAGADPDPIIDFFESPLGLRIIALETDARRAFLDPDIEEAAREKVRGDDVPEERADLIEEFITANDLVDLNISGAMNTNFAFYKGLANAELFEMSEQEILDRVWNQAGENREDTEEWLRAYLTLAYEPLSNDEIRTYIGFSESEAGRRLNRALFAGFGDLYGQQYRALELAVANQLMSEEL